MRPRSTRAGWRSWTSTTSRVSVSVVGLLVVASTTALPASGAARSTTATSGSHHAAAKLRTSTQRTKRRTNKLYPVGTSNPTEPSKMSPPSPHALAGYTLTYANDFTGAAPLAGWAVYSGTPSGASNTQWANSHVVAGHGLLQLNAFQDPAFHNEWVTGGLCQCSVAKTYGAYFVRSRVTGAGPTQVDLLWPAGTDWPPEIDFNETYGSDATTMATVHYTSANLQVHSNLNIDMTQWHTWGVVWTATSVIFTVDGRVWGRVSGAARIPHEPMHLGIQQQTFCSANWACPSSPQSVQVNWVAEYSPTSSGT